MARLSLLDHLQNYCFWLVDVAPIGPTAMPIFSPGAGFASISAPELTIEMADIVEGNSTFVRKVIKRAEVGSISLTRGATFYDSDFYRWTQVALTGNPLAMNFGPAVAQLGGPSARRTLLLIQFFRHSSLPRAATSSVTGALVGGLVAGINAADGGASTLDVSGFAAGGAAALGAAGALVGAVAPYEIALRLPARAWLLYGCLPKRYKAGGDFDAMSADVSIMELEIEVERFEELSLLA